MPYETVKHAGRERSRYIPAGATKLKQKDGLAVVYVYPSRERLIALAYVGNAAKPAFHYSYRNQREVAAKVATFFDGLAARETRKATRRKEASTPHTLVVGDIITYSWGYDQTNVDWFRIVKVSRNYAWLQPIAAATVLDGGTGPMSGHCVADVDVSGDDPSTWGLRDLKGKVEKHAVSASNHVNMPHGVGSKWNGRPIYESWYA